MILHISEDTGLCPHIFSLIFVHLHVGVFSIIIINYAFPLYNNLGVKLSFEKLSKKIDII